MKFINKEPSAIMQLALSAMLFSTCGEDEDTMKGTCIEEIGPDIFHITYALDNPYDAMDFQIAIDVVKDTLGAFARFHYHVFRSKYGDDGEFNISFD